VTSARWSSQILALGLSAVAAALLCACTSAGVGPEMAQSETAAVGWAGDVLGRPDPAMIAQGRQIAVRNCSSCHAIDRRSTSPKPGVPPLRDVLALYEADNLAYRLIEGMRVGHDDMPLFDLDVRTADALIAYIGTISGPGD
jgi:mono/diheme cytochrome c family protein